MGIGEDGFVPNLGFHGGPSSLFLPFVVGLDEDEHPPFLIVVKYWIQDLIMQR